MSQETPTHERLLSSSKFIYLAKPNIHGLVTHKHRGTTLGNVAVLREDEDKDALFQGVFLIDTRKFHLDPNGTMGFSDADVAKTKLSCLLSAVPKTQAFADFRFAAEDYPLMINNLKSVMKSVSMPADFKIKPCFDDNRVGNDGTLVRLNHSLFERITEHTPIPKYSFDDWCPLLEDKNRPSFERLGYYAKHQIAPLPVYKYTDKKWVAMEPHEYRSLQEAIVRVIFTIVHWTIGSKKEVMFNLIPCGIYLLRRKYTTEPPSAQIANRKRAFLLDSSDSESGAASKVQKTAQCTTQGNIGTDSAEVASNIQNTAESTAHVNTDPRTTTDASKAGKTTQSTTDTSTNPEASAATTAAPIVDPSTTETPAPTADANTTGKRTPASSIDPDATSDDDVDADKVEGIVTNDK